MKLQTLTAKELRSKKPAEVEKYIATMQKSKAELLHTMYTGKENKSHQINLIKKSIARAKLVLREAKIGKEQ